MTHVRRRAPHISFTPEAREVLEVTKFAVDLRRVFAIILLTLLVAETQEGDHAKAQSTVIFLCVFLGLRMNFLVEIIWILLTSLGVKQLLARHHREDEVKVAPVDSNVVVLRNPARLMFHVVHLNFFLSKDVPAALEGADCVEVL